MNKIIPEGVQEVKKESIGDIPSIYYSATSNLVSKIDPYASKIMGKALLPGGTAIAMTINLIKNPDNKGKVIASTVLTGGFTFTVMSMTPGMLLAEAATAAAFVALGVSATPLAITLVAATGLAVIGTIIGSTAYSHFYDLLSSIEVFFPEAQETDIFTLHANGKVTKEELTLILDEMEENKTISCLEPYRELKSLRSITNIENKSLASHIKVNQKTNKVNIQDENLNKVKPIVSEVLKDDSQNRLKKHDIQIKTTEDNDEYTVMKKELLESIARKQKWP